MAHRDPDTSGEKEETEFAGSFARGQQQQSVVDPPGSNLLDYVLNQKKMELLRSPEVMQFLQGFQSQTRQNKIHNQVQSKGGEEANSSGKRLHCDNTPSTAHLRLLGTLAPLVARPSTESENTAVAALQQLKQHPVSMATRQLAPPVKMARLELQPHVNTVMAATGGQHCPAGDKSAVGVPLAVTHSGCIASSGATQSGTDTQRLPGTKVSSSVYVPGSKGPVDNEAQLVSGIWSREGSAFTSVTRTTQPKQS